MLDQAWSYLAKRFTIRPEVAIILGSGLGQLAQQIERPESVRFADIPGFSSSTAGGHRGELIAGKLFDVPVVVMSGRLHRYEGHTHAEVTFPVRVMHRLGAGVLVASNAAGGVHPKLCVGDIVIIRDCIDWMRGVVGECGSASGMSVPQRHHELFDSWLCGIAMESAMTAGFAAYEGCYLAMLGPCYETRAEYRMLRRIGVDVVGMSTIPEILVARQLGMRTLALSMVSNVARPDEFVQANHEEVLAAGRAAAAKMESIVRSVLHSITCQSSVPS